MTDTPTLPTDDITINTDSDTGCLQQFNFNGPTTVHIHQHCCSDDCECQKGGEGETPDCPEPEPEPEPEPRPEPVDGMTPIDQHFDGEYGRFYKVGENSANQLMVAGSWIPGLTDAGVPEKHQGWLVKFSRDYSQAKEMIVVSGNEHLRGCAALSPNRNVIGGQNWLALIDDDLNILKSVTIPGISKIHQVVVLKEEIYCVAQHEKKHAIIRLSASLEPIGGLTINRGTNRHLIITPDQQLLTTGGDDHGSALVLLSPDLKVNYARRAPPATINLISVANNGDIYTSAGSYLIRYDKELNALTGVALSSCSPMSIAAHNNGFTLQTNTAGYKELYSMQFDASLQPGQVSRISLLPDGPVSQYYMDTDTLSNSDLVTVGELYYRYKPMALANNQSIIDSPDNWQVESVTDHPFTITPYSYEPEQVDIQVEPFNFTVSESNLEVIYR